MGPPRGARWLVLVVVAVLFGAGVVPAEGAPFPSVKLIASSDEVVIERFPDEPIFFDLGVYVASVGGPFELRVRHHPYDEPFKVGQVVPGTARRRLPSSILNGWNGLADFFEITITDDDGQPVFEESSTFCPGGYARQRVNDSGPQEPIYPELCGGHPFARSMVWGIEKGWAVDPFGYDGPQGDLPDGEYDIKISIPANYRKLFGIPLKHAEVTMHATVTTVPFGEEPEPPVESSTVSASDSGAPRASTKVPTMRDPDASLLPDLRSLPAYHFATSHATDTAQDFLDFAAHEWNEGPQPMVVEAFRRPGEDFMDAYQYFYRDGKPVGRAKVGKMEYHAGGGHDHWHILQFTSYSLLDMDRNVVVDAGKQSWCLVPTDPIDLTVPGAVWRPWEDGLGSSCGGNTSMWIRESIPVGWGDTYYQVAGQAFDITSVPNGDYLVRIKVNPLGKLYEESRTNNASFRTVTLGGEPGARTVTSEPYEGIDTEGDFYP